MRFSIVIPARDEGRFIGRCLESIRVAAVTFPGQVETIVVLNRCSDGTEEIAHGFGIGATMLLFRLFRFPPCAAPTSSLPAGSSMHLAIGADEFYYDFRR